MVHVLVQLWISSGCAPTYWLEVFGPRLLSIQNLCPSTHTLLWILETLRVSAQVALNLFAGSLFSEFNLSRSEEDARVCIHRVIKHGHY
jgi:hypothetical protein